MAEANEAKRELEIRWTTEKEQLTALRELKNRIEALRAEADIEERRGDLQKVAEIRYGRIPELESELKEGGKKLKKFQEERGLLKEEVTEEEIASIVAMWSGIPVSKMLESEMVKLARMEEELTNRVLGQPEAIAAVSNALRRSRAGVAEEGRPIGSFLFLGPTGVGKTELAKALAQFMFNDEESLVRIDMSEYMEKHSVSKMTGSPPGYIGHDEGGQLTETIRRKPYSVVLFDEVEKAHPDVFNLMLQILDDGHITDTKGRKVNFKNTIIVMTSNIGSGVILDAGTQGKLGFSSAEESEVEEPIRDKEEVHEKVMHMLKEHFRPEFLNRIDETIIFQALGKKELRFIIDLQLETLANRLMEKRISLTFSKKAKDHLAEKGYDPMYGARPLRRVIQDLVLNPISMKIVTGEITDESKVKVDLRDGALSFAVSIPKHLMSTA